MAGKNSEAVQVYAREREGKEMKRKHKHEVSNEHMKRLATSFPPHFSHEYEKIV